MNYFRIVPMSEEYTSDYEEEEKKENKPINPDTDPVLNDRRYKEMKLFFKNQLKLDDKWKCLKLCIQNGVDTMEKLKETTKETLQRFGIEIKQATVISISASYRASKMMNDLNTSDYEYDEKTDDDDPVLNDERYKEVKTWFESEILLFDKLKYFKLCIQNDIDTMEKLKAIKKEKLISFGIESFDAETITIKTRMIHL